MPDCAIMGDTGWEPAAVYDHLRWLMSGNVLPFPVHIVSAGNIRDDLVARSNGEGGRFITVPFFLKHANGKHGISRRQCSNHYKIEPVRKKVRELLGKGPRDRIAPGAVEKWIGISTDEIIRATPSRVRFEVNRHPLIEKRMSRQDCLAWLKRNGYPPPPKSSCIGCPFHSNSMWRDMRDNDVGAWADAVEIDRIIRNPVDRPGVPKMRGSQFMHAQRIPLSDVDLSTAEDRGQLNMFNHECEGMCGV
ncbi:hypothetical protein BJ122_102237 [Rhodopseudomonas faecalis]|uniref:3'-phosphoadenosine 5'-phosphosulfate sulfotransferase (PAPS reductase)/FAD synthetase n=2 Tax=Rhodopseudomonas faecalis TaxID=99655 RepID=A0A318TJG1_9BRAD|nr:hypothetical protein BJ122_102237 [Rhodopseudomonas faecalis]